MGLASDTRLEIEECHFAPIRELKNGASITVGALHQTDEDEGEDDTKDLPKLGWAVDAVALSSATGAGSGPSPMVLLSTRAGTELAITSDQPMMLAGDSLEVACKLVLGSQPMRANGHSDEVTELRFGEHEGSVHAIAAGSMTYRGEAGHLLNAEGLVVGDYVLQMHMSQAMVPTR